jgi:hypothetical protein
MGSGWKIPAGTRYNGEAIKEPMTLSSLNAVFFKNKKGEVEVMDHKDARYFDMVVPYIAANIASPFIGGKAIAAFKSISSLSRAATIGEKASYVAGVGNLVSAGVDIGSHFHHEMSLKPEAISRISSLMATPQKMKTDTLRDELNVIFEQYSYKNGPNLEQYYVRPLAKNENPFVRLQELSSASIKNVDVYQNPFDRKPKTLDHIDMEESRNKVKEDISFQRGFLSLSKKVLSGAPLSDQENIMLRFGINVYFGTAYDIADKQGRPLPVAETREIIKEGFSMRGEPNEYIDSQLQKIEGKVQGQSPIKQEKVQAHATMAPSV